MYFRKIALIGFLCLSYQSIAYSQSSEQLPLSSNSVYFDLSAGLASQVSINYERGFYRGEKTFWFGRIGIGEAGALGNASGAGIIGAVTMLTGKSNNHFELNTGVFLIQDNGYLLLDIGYRFQKPEGGLIFKTHLGTLGAGIGLGFAF